jgi:hypothetical protein
MLPNHICHAAITGVAHGIILLCALALLLSPPESFTVYKALARTAARSLALARCLR